MPAYCKDAACCSLTEKQLVACRGFGDGCPGYEGENALGELCPRCPVGQCRVGTQCMCPEMFGTRRWKSECEATHGLVWPHSVGKEENMTGFNASTCGTKTKQGGVNSGFPLNVETIVGVLVALSVVGLCMGFCCQRRKRRRATNIQVQSVIPVQPGNPKPPMAFEEIEHVEFTAGVAMESVRSSNKGHVMVSQVDGKPEDAVQVYEVEEGPEQQAYAEQGAHAQGVQVKQTTIRRGWQ